jgi:hypothetical protein
LASGYEAATQVRAHNLPTFAATAPFDHTRGPLQQGSDHAQAGMAAAPSSAQATAATSAAGHASDPASMATVRKLPRHL